MGTRYEDLSEEIKKLFDDYLDIFGVYPDYYEELDLGWDVEHVKESIEKKIELPVLYLGENYWEDGNDY